eukprot:2171299-Amphidinium_carterae.1
MSTPYCPRQHPELLSMSPTFPSIKFLDPTVLDCYAMYRIVRYTMVLLMPMRKGTRRLHQDVVVLNHRTSPLSLAVIKEHKTSQQKHKRNCVSHIGDCHMTKLEKSCFLQRRVDIYSCPFGGVLPGTTRQPKRRGMRP